MLKENIKNQVKEAMKAKNMPRLSVLRQITAAIKQVEIDTREELNEEEVLKLLEKLKKQRLDAKEQFLAAQRTDLADKEEFELNILNEFFPEQLTSEQINNIVKKAISETGAAKVSDMQKVIELIRPQVLGKASIQDIAKQIREQLA